MQLSWPSAAEASNCKDYKPIYVFSLMLFRGFSEILKYMPSRFYLIFKFFLNLLLLCLPSCLDLCHVPLCLVSTYSAYFEVVM